MKKKRLFTVVGILLGICLVAGISVTLASPSYGTESDPLVTKSYLETVKSEILDTLDDSITEAEQDLTNKFAAAQSADGTVFVAVTVPKGKIVKCQAGTEVLVRSSGAVSIATSTAVLSDTTDGTSFTVSGKGLSENHLYMAQAVGAGVKAYAGDITVLVRGAYTVEY